MDRGRRRLLSALGATISGAALAAGGMRAFSQPAKPKAPRVVVLGGGFAGVRVAMLLRRLAPFVEVILIEKNREFIPSPSFIEYIFGQQKLSEFTYTYEGLKSLGIQVLHEEARAIDPMRHEVRFANETLSYTYLVLATGIRLAYEDIPGLAGNEQENFTIYDRHRLTEIHARLHAFRGGNVVISVPDSALACPPAPYEFSLLLAQHIKRKQLDAKVILLDSGVQPQPKPLSKLFEEEIGRHADVIEYVPATGISLVNAKARRVETTHGEAFDYAWLSLVPNNKIAPLVANLKLAEAGDTFPAVDPLTMRCVNDEHLYAPGDVARNPYGKSAYAAYACAEMCARDIAQRLDAKIPEADPVVRIECFPYVRLQEATNMRVRYQVETGKDGVHLKSHVDVEPPSIANAQRRKSWQRRVLSEAFNVTKT